jgi:hypothetical protein
VAAIEPVLVIRDLNHVDDTGWVVIVQQRHNDIIDPLLNLRYRVILSGLLPSSVVLIAAGISPLLSGVSIRDCITEHPGSDRYRQLAAAG